MPNFTIEYYEKANGERPAEEFLAGLDKKMRARAVQYISLLSEKGNELREPYSKNLSDGIFELRIKQGSDISRVMYFFYIGKRIVMTNGFIKKTQRTPRSEIRKAKKYRDDYISRMENNKDE